MKRFFIIILILCNYYILLSQSIVFNNLYNLPSDTTLVTSGMYAGQYVYNDDIISDIVEISGSTFITTGYGNNQWSWSNSPTHYYLSSIRINKFGTILNDTIIDFIYEGIELGNIIISKNNNIYMAGYKNDSISDVLDKNLLLKLSNDLSFYNIIDLEYGDTACSINYMVNIDSFIFTSNSYYYNSQYDFNLTKLDLNGNILDTLIFNSPYRNYGSILKKYNDSILLVVEQIDEDYDDWYSIFHQVNIYTKQIVSSSQIISFYNNKQNLIRDIKITENNEMYACGWYRDVLGVNRARTALMKLDINGNIVWKKFYDLDQNSNNDDFFGNVEETENGDLVLFGLYLNSNSYYKGKLMRIEKNSGDIIWERLLQRDTQKYVNSGYDDILYKMQKTSDGGYILNGRANNVELIGDTSPIKRGADAWLVKTDSCGFTEGDFPVPSFIVENIKKYTVTIKNTSGNYCTASINYGNGDSTKFYAYNTPRPDQFTYTFTDTGTYTIKLTALAGEEFRSYENTIKIYGDTTVGVQEIQVEQFVVHLFPNPAQNQVSIVFNEDLVQKNAKIKAKVFNVSGKEILTSEFNTNIQKQNVDISMLSNGVYYMSFYNSENLNLGTKKFVVLK